MTPHDTAERVRRAMADVYVVNGRGGTYVTTVLCVNDDGHKGRPYTATCTCPAGRRESPGGAHLTTTNGCWHVREAMRQSERLHQDRVKSRGW